jgi:hypothetical protein
MKHAEYDQTGKIIGFYAPEINGENIPVNSMKITEEQWQECLSNQGFRGVDIVSKTIIVITPPPPPDPLPQPPTVEERITGVEDIIMMLLT